MKKRNQNQVTATLFICLSIFIYGISASNASTKTEAFAKKSSSNKTVTRSIASE